MSICSYHRHFVGSDIKEDTVHYGTKIIVCGAEDRLLDSALQHVSRDSQFACICFRSRHLRILVTIHTHKRIGTVLTNHVHGKVILIDRECQRLLTELLQRLQQQLSCRSYFATTFCAIYFYTRTNRRLTVRSG